MKAKSEARLAMDGQEGREGTERSHGTSGRGLLSTDVSSAEVAGWSGWKGTSFEIRNSPLTILPQLSLLVTLPMTAPCFALPHNDTANMRLCVRGLDHCAQDSARWQ